MYDHISSMLHVAYMCIAIAMHISPCNNTSNHDGAISIATINSNMVRAYYTMMKHFCQQFMKVTDCRSII